MSEKFVFTMQGLCKRYGSRNILDNINLSFYAGAKIGIVGENGSGKSTLLRIMAGIDKDFEGHAEPLKGVRVGYVPQEPRLQEGLSVRENLLLGMKATTDKLDRFDAISGELEDPKLKPEKMEKLMDEMARIQDDLDATQGWEVDRQVDLAADALFLPPDTAEVEKLSGGERRRVFLARTLLEKPDILLLDEPTNHLDAETVYWLENHLREYAGTVIIVTHDRYFLDNITRWILELDRTKGIPFEGNYSAWLGYKANQKFLEGKKVDEHSRVMQRELEWLKSSPKGRRTKSKSRVKEYEKLSGMDFEVHENSMEIQIPPGRHLGDLVIRAENVSKSFGDQVLLKDVNFDIPAGAIVGIIGPNGVGKTTLFRMVMQEEKPDSGVLTIGPSVELSHVNQGRDDLDDNKTIFEEIADGLDFISLADRRISARSYVGKFNFKGSDQQKKVGHLSGGERNRVHLAKLLRRGGNVLLLDEPTNDLDTDTMRYLEEGLQNFNSCALVISHDRYFLDRVCTHLLVFEGEGRISWHEGAFQDYLDERGEKESIFENRRAKYKKLHL